MSMNARRYRFGNGDLKLVPRTERLTDHHVPPRNPDPQPRYIQRVDDRHHRAYHLLFKAAATYEDACKILLADWWTYPSQQPRH